MVLPAQFQLGLELTNIVNPISQAVSALGSLALIDAIKKSGSDFITETKLASLIGRHRIDPVIKFHFREMVAKSDQSVISRYLDIILESGSGPTVQEALKNPALFSMVIQLSGLAFAHEDESLANAIVEAIEKIVQKSGGDMGIVPDYVSLLGTIQACQQQTAAFRWALLYEAVEEKIYMALRGLNVSRDEISDSIRCRSLPLPVLQGLLMWLNSLQSFPEHRLLHLRCNTGISTVVVWCHHILGLSLITNIQGIEVRFGDAPYSLVVEESQSQKAGVSLMDPLDPQEPLFTLQSEENSIGISYERRAEAYGYGAKFFLSEGYPEEELQERAQWVISHSVESRKFSRISGPPYYPSENRLLSAGRFLFALDESVTVSSGKSAGTAEWSNELRMGILVGVVVTFARIPEDDLARCREMPLALDVMGNYSIQEVSRPGPQGFLDILNSFGIMSFLLLGSRMSHNNYIERAVLVSAWGWSIFFDSIEAVDPFDVPTDTLRISRGVPSRRGFRRTRITDGPDSSLLPGISPYYSDMCKYLIRGLSTAEKGVVLVGHHSDAFQVTQISTCGTQTYRYGFRAMTEWSIRPSRLPPCQCDKPRRECSTLTSKHSTSSAHKFSAIENLIAKNSLIERVSPGKRSRPLSELERVFILNSSQIYFYYVSDNPAARWLQLGALQGDYGPRREEDNARYHVVLGGPNTCVDCAVRCSESLPPYTVVLL